MFEVLFGLGILLVFVTLIGHGLWLLLAALYRAIVRTEGAKEPVCPNCHLGVAADAQRCPRCKVALRSIAAEKLVSPLVQYPKRSGDEVALDLLCHEIHWLRSHRHIDAETEARLLSAIELQLSPPVPDDAAAPAAARGDVGAHTHDAEPLEIVDADFPSHAASPPAKPPVRPREASSIESFLAPSPGAPDIPLEEPAWVEPVLAEVVPEESAEDAIELAEAEPAPLGVGARAAQYAARRAMSEAELDEEPVAPRKPHAPVSQLLAAFMEQKNIRWGELVGGLLIVCCSIALVISFWAQIAERPFLKFGVFNGVVAALFGIGLYTQRRWKLETTSHGVLIISTLLVPLNFLAIAAFSGSAEGWNFVTLGGEAFSAVLFGTLILWAGNVLTPGAARQLAIGVLVPALLTLLVRRFIAPGVDPGIMLLLALAILVVYCGVNAWVLARTRRVADLDEREINLLFKVLGMTSFATVLPLGLILFKAGLDSGALRTLAPLFTLLAAPSVAVGGLIWRRADKTALSDLRLAGTTIGVIGVVLSLAAVPIAWPEPGGMLIGAAINGLVMLGIAAALRIPVVHIPALGCLLAAGWLALLIASGEVAWNGAAAKDVVWGMLSRRSALGLAGLSALPILAAVWFGRRGQTTERRIYAAGSGIVAALSIGLISWHGLGVLGDTSGAVYVYALYSAALLAYAWSFRTKHIVWAALVLAQLALVQGLVFTFAESLELSQPWKVAALLGAAFACAIAVASTHRGVWHDVFAVPARAFALAASVVAAMLILADVPRLTAWESTVYAAALTLVWLTISLASRRQGVFGLFQAGLVGTVLLAVTACLQSRDWYAATPLPWIDPWALQAYALALTALAMVWLGLRSWLPAEEAAELPLDDSQLPVTNWRTDARHTLQQSLPALDDLLGTVALAVVLGLSVYSAVPGAAQELFPRNADFSVVGRQVPDASRFALRHVPHVHARELGTWVCMTAVLILLSLSQIRQKQDWKLLGLLLLSATLAPLVAAQFESQVAVASSLRWTSAFYLIAASALVWARPWTTSQLQRVRILDAAPSISAEVVRTAVLLLGLAPLAVMAAYIVISAVLRAPLPAGTSSFVWPVVGVLFILGCMPLLARGADAELPADRGSFDLLRQSGTLAFMLCASPLVAVTASTLR